MASMRACCKAHSIVCVFLPISCSILCLIISEFTLELLKLPRQHLLCCDMDLYVHYCSKTHVCSKSSCLQVCRTHTLPLSRSLQLQLVVLCLQPETLHSVSRTSRAELNVNDAVAPTGSPFEGASAGARLLFFFFFFASFVVRQQSERNICLFG